MTRPATRFATLAVLAVAAAGVAAWALGCSPLTSTPPATDPDAASNFVGSAACASCHAAEFAAWRTSQHFAAMAHAADSSVLGDFADARIAYNGITTTFRRDGARFVVRTDGPDGKLADYEVLFTFGVAPLQQYLVAMPRGRLQALPFAWDTRPRDAGGQRWFHLHPDERVTHDDVLHWTRPSQNWNHMCAECHSTRLVKGYDAAADSFHTTYTEISVGCEQCHGGGATHLTWAKKERGWKGLAASKGLVVALDERHGVMWRPDESTGNATRSAPRTTAREIESCALCHGRRSTIVQPFEHGRPLLDSVRPALLTAGLYSADGTMEDEVYNYGSFLQSKMNARGVTCSDCHEPHSGKLRAEGNAVCATCHDPGKYDRVEHHHHPHGGAAAQCKSCHMPQRTYMQIDVRHDHSFRIPDPSASVAFGTPNTCNDCHPESTPAWAAQHVASWFPTRRMPFQTYVPALVSARAGHADAAARLAEVAGDAAQPPIARSTALAELAGYPGEDGVRTATAALRDANPLVRWGAVEALHGAEPNTVRALALPMLDDSIRAIRLEAASLLATLPPEALDAPSKARIERGLDELLRCDSLDADRAEGQLNIGTIFHHREQYEPAERAFRRGIEIEPWFVPNYLNLADVYRATNRDSLGAVTLKEALRRLPDNADAHHALGLLYVRQKRLDQAIAELGRAAKLAPDNVRYAYVWAVALSTAGRDREAIAALEAAQKRRPGEPMIADFLAQLRAGGTATRQ